MSRAVEIFQKIFCGRVAGKEGVGLSIEGGGLTGGDHRLISGGYVGVFIGGVAQEVCQCWRWNLQNPLGP